MPKFDKRFVYFMWDDILKGKECFVADSIGLLCNFVERNLKSYRYEIIGEGDGKAPFKINGPGNANMVFCYHDPWYDLKVAYERVKTIQAHVSGNMWVNMEDPSWEDPPECYRIDPDEPKKSKPITNRELSKWLAQGNGEYYWYDDEDGFVSECGTELQYPQENANDKVVRVKIRKWEDTDWHVPSRKYIGLEE